MAEKSTALDGFKANFEQLKAAFAEGAVALLAAWDARTNQPAALVIALNGDGHNVEMVPFAVMIAEDPFQRYCPPMLDGYYMHPDGHSFKPEETDA